MSTLTDRAGSTRYPNSYATSDSGTTSGFPNRTTFTAGPVADAGVAATCRCVNSSKRSGVRKARETAPQTVWVACGAHRTRALGCQLAPEYELCSNFDPTMTLRRPGAMT